MGISIKTVARFETVPPLKKYYKPVSRILLLRYARMTNTESGYHLSVVNITVGINLPTLHHRTSRSQAMVYVAFQHARFTPR